MIRIALLAAGMSLAACTPSTEPVPDPATTTAETTPPPAAPIPAAGMPPSGSTTTGMDNPNVPAPDPLHGDEARMTPVDPAPMPNQPAKSERGISAPAPPPIEDPTPTPPPTQ